MILYQATGKRNGKLISILCKFEKDCNPVFVFDGLKNMVFESILRDELGKNRSIGGSYVPEENDPLNIYNVLKHYFFDSKAEVSVIGKLPELPNEEGVIY